MGASRIIGIEPDARHAEMARALGCDDVLTPAMPPGDAPWQHDPELVRQVLERTDGAGVDVAMEMAGFNSAVNNAIRITRRGGQVVLFGVKNGDAVIEDYHRIVMNGLSVRAVVGRQIFATWEITKALLEDPRNGIQQAVFDTILNGGDGTMVGIEDWDKASFEQMIRTHPKVLIRFAADRPKGERASRRARERRGSLDSDSTNDEPPRGSEGVRRGRGASRPEGRTREPASAREARQERPDSTNDGPPRGSEGGLARPGGAPARRANARAGERERGAAERPDSKNEPPAEARGQVARPGGASRPEGRTREPASAREARATPTPQTTNSLAEARGSGAARRGKPARRRTREPASAREARQERPDSTNYEPPRGSEGGRWRGWEESNPNLRIRSPTLYPLSYGC